MSADLLGKVPQRTVAARFGLSLSAVNRHAQNHLSPSLALVPVAPVWTSSAADSDLSPLDRLRRLAVRTEAILTTAEGTGNTRQMLDAVRELRAVLVELGRASGEFQQSPAVVVNLAVMPEWLAVRAAVMEVLTPGQALTLGDKLARLEAG